MTFKERILVIAHGHPDFSLGGGEIAAYNLFKAYREQPDVAEGWFLARANRGRGATGALSLRRENEYLWEQAVRDYHGTSFKAADSGSLLTKFSDLVRALRPTVVHTHHYAHLGLEYLRVIKQVDPTIRIVMTLHEYMAICRNNGQMIKTGTFKLCSRESFDDCRQCFPQSSAEDFWLRKHYFRSHFEFVDQFIAPSEFLRQRYVAWGLQPERVQVIENGQSDASQQPPRSLSRGETRSRLGFFGQINPYKGLDVVLQALSDMSRLERSKLVVEVHGANLEWQPTEYRERIDRLRTPLIEQGVVQWLGPYQPHELPDRMAGVDWVLVPSIWWENSPMVIQEAFVYGRPVIASAIGGMREKVRDGIDGLHVPAGMPNEWKTTLLAAARFTDRWDALRQGILKPLSYSQCAIAHLLAFREWKRKHNDRYSEGQISSHERTSAETIAKVKPEPLAHEAA